MGGAEEGPLGSDKMAASSGPFIAQRMPPNESPDRRCSEVFSQAKSQPVLLGVQVFACASLSYGARIQASVSHGTKKKHHLQSHKQLLG